MPILAYVGRMYIGLSACLIITYLTFFFSLVQVIMKAKNLMLHLRLPQHQYKLYTQHEHFIGKHKQLFSSTDSWYSTDHNQRYRLLSGISWITSVLVCLAITTNPPLRGASNYLLFTLVIADLIVTLVCKPLILEFISNLTFFHGCIIDKRETTWV